MCDGNKSDCAEITHHIHYTNSWTCRSCFNIRVHYHFTEVETTGFDAEGSLLIAFDNPVIMVKFAYPVIAIDRAGTDKSGNHLYKFRFAKHHIFGDARMDFNAGKAIFAILLVTFFPTIFSRISRN